MEEGTEVVHKNFKAFETGEFGKNLPVITSCSPGWIKFMETFFADIREHISTDKYTTTDVWSTFKNLLCEDGKY